MSSKEKTWNISTHDCIHVSFYATHDGSGGAFREQLRFLCKQGSHMNTRYLRMCERKAKTLNARSFRMFITIPRAFSVQYPEDECDRCGR